MSGGVSEVWFDSGATVTLWLDSATRSPEGEARQCQEDTKVEEKQCHRFNKVQERLDCCQEWRHCPAGVGCPSCSKGGRWPPPSSCPMCLARSVPSFFTSLPAPTCQPPSDALSPTLLFCPVHFSVKGMVLSVIGCVGRYWHGGSLEGRYYGSVVISPRLQRHICH